MKKTLLRFLFLLLPFAAMAQNVKISDMVSATDLVNAWVPIVQNNQNKKAASTLFASSGAFWPLMGNASFTGSVNMTGSATNTLKLIFNSLNTVQTDGAGIWLVNPSLAGVSAQQISPSITWEGQGWKTGPTAASQSVKFTSYVLPVQGLSTAIGSWKLDYSINGGAYTNALTVGTVPSSTFFSINGNTFITSSNKLNFNGGTTSIYDGNILTTGTTSFNVLPNGDLTLGSNSNGSVNINPAGIGPTNIGSGSNDLNINIVNCTIITPAAGAFQLNDAFNYFGAIDLTSGGTAKIGTISMVLDLDEVAGSAIFTDGSVSKKGIQYSTTGYVTQIHSLTDKEYVDTADATAWKLSGTSTLTGITTITSNASNQLIFNGSLTESANNQFYMQINPAITGPASINRTGLGIIISPAFTSSSNTSTLVALDVSPTYSLGSFTATKTINIRSGSNGMVLFGASTPTNTAVGNAVLELQSASQALLLTRIATEGSIVTPIPGMVYYNSTSNSFRFYNGSWGEFFNGTASQFWATTGISSLTGTTYIDAQLNNLTIGLNVISGGGANGSNLFLQRSGTNNVMTMSSVGSVTNRISLVRTQYDNFSDVGKVDILTSNPSGIMSVSLHTDNTLGIGVTDGINAKGFYYTSDYTGNLSTNDRLIPDYGGVKIYADAHLAGLTFTNSPSVNGQVPTYNGTNITWQAPASNLIVGTSTITSGTNTKVLFDNSGVLGEYTISGTGNVAMTSNPVFSNPSYTGTMTTGTMGFSDTGNLLTAQSSTNSYNQIGIQNTSNGTTASTNFVVNNDQATSTTNFGEFGMNSSGFTGSGAWNIAGAVYLDAASTDLSIGTLANKPIHFFTNSSTTDAITISGAGAVSLPLLGNGILKTSSNVISLATSGTDYAPATSGSSILKGNGSGGFSNASAGTDYLAPSGSGASLTGVYLLASGGTLSGANTITGTSTNTLTLSFSSLNQTVTDGAGVYLKNTTAATVSQNQNSPYNTREGSGWKTNATAGAQSVKFVDYVTTITGTSSPTGYLGFYPSVNGAAYSATPSLAVHTSGSVLVGTTAPISNELQLVRSDQNASTFLGILNATSNTAANASLLISTSSSFATYGIAKVLSAGFTSSGMLVADSWAIAANGLTGGMNIGTQSNHQFSVYTNNISRMSITNGGVASFTGTVSATNHIPNYTTTATAAGTTVLTVSSNYYQAFTGSTTQTVTLPVATTLVNGQGFFFTNASSGVVTVQTSGANTIKAMAANSTLLVFCVNTAGGTGTASWNWTYNSTGLNN